MSHFEEAAAFIAKNVGLPGHEAGLAELLGVCHWMHEMQVARQEVLANPPPRPPGGWVPGPEQEYLRWHEQRDDPDGWNGEDWDRFIRRRPGRPRNDPLIIICQMVGHWWEEVLRERWAPSFGPTAGYNFATGAEGKKEMVPINRAGWLLLRVAQELGDYTVENCGAVADRVKQMRKSPAAKERREQQRRAYTKERRAKKRPE